MERPVGRNSCKISITLIVVELDGQSALAWEEIGIGECGGVSGFDLIGGAFGWAAGSLPTRNAGYAELIIGVPGYDIL
jgi:hypothetical protein